MNRLNAINVGTDVPTILENNWNAESGAIRAYNDAIRLAVEVGDNGTRALLESILADEESHIDWIEEQRDQLQQMGVENYLANQAAG